MAVQVVQLPDNVMRFPPGLGWGDMISAGSVGMVLEAGDVVVKIPIRAEEDAAFIEVEKQVYERLANEHAGVLHYLGPFCNGLLLRRAPNGSVRHYLRSDGRSPPGLALQLRWARQAVEAIVFIHGRTVLHADICCNNLFLDDELNVKLGDFSGSSIDGRRPLVFYQTSHAHPDLDISVQSEIFALGSTIYEIITGAPPYDGMPDEEIAEAYRGGVYPAVPAHPLAEIVGKCWRREYSSADEVLQEIKARSMFNADRSNGSRLNMSQSVE